MQQEEIEQLKVKLKSLLENRTNTEENDTVKIESKNGGTMEVSFRRKIWNRTQNIFYKLFTKKKKEIIIIISERAHNKCKKSFYDGGELLCLRQTENC